MSQFILSRDKGTGSRLSGRCHTSRKKKSPEPTSKLGTSVSVCNLNMLLARRESDASLKAQKFGVCGGRMKNPASKWKVKTDTEVDL